jgi:hypothetical protein
MADTTPLPCTRCKAPTVEIRLAAGEDQLLMRSCSRCDHRVWLRAGSPAELDEVLDSVATTGRRRSA